MTETSIAEHRDSTDSSEKLLSLHDIVAIIEGLIFASPEPISAQRIVEIVSEKCPEITPQQVQETLNYLENIYSDHRREFGRGFELVTQSGGYVFRTVAYAKEYIQSHLQDKPQKLSPAQLEVLSIVAYRQPITRFMVEEVRGVDCSSSIKRLLSLKLLKILGKAEGMGKPLLYGTTKEFLELFSLNSLRDLPTLNEYRELDKDSEATQVGPEDKVSVLDLFDSSEVLNSEGVLKSSAEALAELDRALHRVIKTTKTITAANSEEIVE